MTKQQIQQTFESYPDKSELYETPDEILFLTANDAENYCKSKKIDAAAIKEHKRSEIEQDAKPTKEAKPAKEALEDSSHQAVEEKTEDAKTKKAAKK